MANYDANIRVNADTRQAEAQLSKLQQILEKLDKPRQGVRNIGEAFVPQRQLRGLEKALNDVVGRVNTTEKAFARLVEGIGTAAATGTALEGLNAALKSAAVYTGQVADNFSGAGRQMGAFARQAGGLEGALAQINDTLVDAAHNLQRAVVPGFSALDDSAQASAHGINAAQNALQNLLDSSAGLREFVQNFGSMQSAAAPAAAALAALAAVMEGELSKSLYDVEQGANAALGQLGSDAQAGISELQRLIRATQGTSTQYENLLRIGRERMAMHSSDSTEARKAANTITQAQQRLNDELERQNDLLREARGLRAQSVENRATNTYNTTQRRNSFLAEQSSDLEALYASLARLDGRQVNWADALGIDAMEGATRRVTRLEAAYNKNQTALKSWTNAIREGTQWVAEMQQAMGAEAADAFTRALLNQQRTLDAYTDSASRATQAIRDLGYGGEAPALRPAGFTDQDVRISNLLTDQKAAVDIVAEYERKVQKISNDAEIDAILRARNAEIDAIEDAYRARTKADEAWWGQHEKRLNSRPDVNGPGARAARNQQMESLALGVGFPLLFGGGVGSVAGAAAGSFVGSGFGGQILGGAIGQAIDNFILNVTDLAKSLKNPTEALKAMETAGLRVSDSLRYNVQLLSESGRAYDAQRLILSDLNRQLGKNATQSLFALAEEQKRLGGQWNALTNALRANVIPALTGSVILINRLAGALSGLGQVGLPKWLVNILTVTNPSFALSRGQFEFARNIGVNAGRNAQAPGLAPEVQDQMRQAQRQTADEIKSAYREGFQLQRAAIDLERQGADLRRRIADDIFNKQQQVLRSQIEADRLRRQLAIETVDLEYRRRIANEEGRVAQVLEAEAALMRTRAQGEAELEARRKTLELDIAKQQRDTQNYVYQLSRDIDNIRRSTLQHEMDVADYRLKIERQIQDQRRLDAAASGAAAGVGSSAVGSAGFTANQLTLATREAAKFTGVANMCSESVKAFYKSLGVSLPGVTAWADTVRKAGTVMKDWSKLRPGDIVATGRPGDTTHVGVYTGGNNVFHQSRSRGLVSGNFPDLNYFKQGGYFVRPNATIGNLNNAASAIRRPNVPMVGASGVAGAMASLDAKDAQIKGKQLTLQAQLNKLGEDAATQRLLEVARGPKELEQRRQAVALAKAELDVVIPGSRVVQERLAFEAQALVKLQQRRDEDARILELTKAQGKEREDLKAKLAEGLRITEQQIALDREALKLAQDKAYAVERASLESQLGVTGQGRAAGFIGNAAGAYENALLQYGDAAKAKEIATLTEQIDMARLASDAWEGSLRGVGSAFADVMTTGVASLTTGTAAAQQIFASFLTSVADALMSAAANMIATYVAIGIARAFAFGGSPAPSSGTDLSGGVFQGFANNGSGFPLGLGFRAAGGPVAGGMPYIVGENGPELFVPGVAGRVITNQQTEALMASRSALSTQQSNGSAGSAFADNREALSATATTTRERNVERYLTSGATSTEIKYSRVGTGDLPFVTEQDMLQATRLAAQEGAKLGQQRTLAALRSNPSTRRSVGV